MAFLGALAVIAGLIMLGTTLGENPYTEKIKSAEKSAGYAALFDTTENYSRYQQGLPPVENEEEGRVEQLKEQEKDWKASRKTRRIIGASAAGGGLVVALLGVVAARESRQKWELRLASPAAPRPAAAPPPPSAPAQTGDIASRLRALDKMLDDGLITAEEHQANRARILSDT